MLKLKKYYLKIIMNIKQNTTLSDKVNSKNYLTEDSNLDQIFEWISESNFDSEELKQFIQENISFFASENFRKKLIEKWTKLKDKNDMIMIVFLITFIDSINEKNQLNKTIIDELSITKQLINKIIQSNEEDIQSYNSQQKIIIQKAKQLEESIIILENEINQYKQIIKSQSNNLKENIGTIEKLSKKEELLKKALKQSHELVKEWKDLGIFIEVANTKWELRINSTAVDAVGKQSIHSHEEKDFKIKDEPSTSSIIKAWESTNIKPFKLKQIWKNTGTDSQTTETHSAIIEEQEYNSEDIKKMMDRIYDLEQQSLLDTQKIEELEKIANKRTRKIEKLKAENNELDEKNKKLVNENDSLQKTVIVSAWSRFNETKKED